MNNKKLIISSKIESIQFKYFFILLITFSATWLISNITAVKLVLVLGLTLTGGFIVFPFTTMLSSIIVEIYGYKNARQAIWAGLLLNLLFVFFINVVNIIPASPYWKLQNEFSDILVPTTRIIIASLVSFMLSDFINSYLMAKMKIKSNGKSLIKRVIISYVFSISLDIICFILLAFAGKMPISLLVQLTITAYFKKVLCQTLLLPLIWYFIEVIKKHEGLEVYDYNTNFNPFSIENVYEITSYKKINSTKSITSTIKSNG